MKEIDDFEKKIGVEFDKQGLLKTALTHRSYLNENREIKEHNERLEFLGDAVLELVVTEYLYTNFDNPEGDMTNWRSALVKTETISEVSKEIGVGEHIFMSKGEAKSLGRSRQLILANAFEAIVGAIYLDQGYDAAKGFINRFLITKLPKIIKDKSYIDSKSLFQELVQEEESVTPTYEVVEEQGPDHDKIFTVAVFVGDTKWGVGTGTSKQLAQLAAAKEGLEKYKKQG